MKSITVVAGLCALMSVAACAPVVQGGPPMQMASGLRETVRISNVYLSTAGVWASEDFADTFREEVVEELNNCATGTYPLDLRMHVDDLHRAWRPGTVVRGEGVHTIAATAELTDPSRGNEVVARYPLQVGAQAGGRLRGLVGDREMMISEEFGRALCAEAFGRNPRGPSITNATPG